MSAITAFASVFNDLIQPDAQLTTHSTGYGYAEGPVWHPVEHGNIWVIGPGGVWVLDPDGTHLGTVHVPEVVGNLHWGGHDWRTLFIPSTTSLYSIPVMVGPHIEPFMGTA